MVSSDLGKDEAQRQRISGRAPWARAGTAKTAGPAIAPPAMNPRRSIIIGRVHCCTLHRNHTPRFKIAAVANAPGRYRLIVLVDRNGIVTIRSPHAVFHPVTPASSPPNGCSGILPPLT